MIPLEVLENVTLFSGLPPDELELLRQISHNKTYRKGSVIINEGERTDALFVVLTGRAIAVSIDDQGRQIVLNEFGPGDHFGEMSFIDKSPRCADVEVTTSTRLMVIPRERFMEVISLNPRICLSLIKGLNDKLRNTTEQVKDLVFRDVYCRVARLFDKISRTHENGSRIIEERLTHQQIADRVGSSREMVSRIFKELRGGGYIDVRNKKISILKELPYKW